MFASQLQVYGSWLFNLMIHVVGLKCFDRIKQLSKCNSFKSKVLGTIYIVLPYSLPEEPKAGCHNL